MAEFKKNTRFSGGSNSRRPFNKSGSDRSFGPRPMGNRYDASQKELFEAECNSCHKKCQVPFRPNGKKPVYCSDCFKQEGGEREERPRFEKREFSHPRPFGDHAPHAHTPPAPPDRRIDDLKRQLDAVQATLEKLVSIVEASNRSADLTKVVRKYVPAEKPATAPTKTKAAPAKKSVKAKSAPAAKKKA